MIFELKYIDAVAKELIQKYKEYSIWCFEGDMGSGKTTLIKSLCKYLNVATEVTSPTFSIINHYKSKDNVNIYHCDLFRIETDIECLNLGISEYIFSGDYCFFEWPEKILFLISEKYLQINLSFVDNTKRDINATIQTPKKINEF